MSLKNKIIYILGGNGLIGQATVKILLDSNAQIIILDNNINDKFINNFPAIYHKQIIQVKFNLEKLNLLEKI